MLEVVDEREGERERGVEKGEEEDRGGKGYEENGRRVVLP